MTEIPQVTFDFDAILADASAAAGLDDFGDDSFREPLKVLLNALDTEANLTLAGRAGQYERLRNLLINRLKVEGWISRHPEILDEKIEAPVVIVGLGHKPWLIQRCIRQLFGPNLRRWLRVQK